MKVGEKIAVNPSIVEILKAFQAEGVDLEAAIGAAGRKCRELNNKVFASIYAAHPELKDWELMLDFEKMELRLHWPKKGTEAYRQVQAERARAKEEVEGATYAGNEMVKELQKAMATPQTEAPGEPQVNPEVALAQ
jgi:hypothetical protein